MKKKLFATVWFQDARRIFKLLPTRLTHIGTGLMLVALACAVSSCSTISAHTTKYAGVPPQPPTQPSAVRILRFQPTQPSQQLGEIVLNVTSDNPQVNQQMEDKLREEAAKLGADAVVVVDARVQQEGATIGAGENYFETVYGQKLVAKAIKYGTLTPTGRVQ
jgi:hypothetical protein